MKKFVTLALQVAFDVAFGLAAYWVLGLTLLNDAWVIAITLGLTAIFAECLEIRLKH